MHLPIAECPPIAVAWPAAPAIANDNGDMRMRDANIAQLIYAIRCKLDLLPPERRELMGQLAASVMNYIVSKEAGHG